MRVGDKRHNRIAWSLERERAWLKNRPPEIKKLQDEMGYHDKEYAREKKGKRRVKVLFRHKRAHHYRLNRICRMLEKQEVIGWKR